MHPIQWPNLMCIKIISGDYHVGLDQFRSDASPKTLDVGLGRWAEADLCTLRCSVPAGITVIAKTYEKLCEVGPSGLKELLLNFLQCR